MLFSRVAIWLEVRWVCIMQARLYHSRYYAHGTPVSLLFILDSFSIARTSWGREQWARSLLEYYFFLGVSAVVVIVSGGCVASGDYLRAYHDFVELYPGDFLKTVVLVSMGNDLIAGTRPIRVDSLAAARVIQGFRLFREAVRHEVRVPVIYGGSASTWGYSPDVWAAYDGAVEEVVAGIAGLFDSVTTGASHLRGVRPVDAIGHLDEHSIFRSGRLLIAAAQVVRSRL